MTQSGISLLTNKNKLETMIKHTQSSTGFSPHLLEKDFYLTLILDYIANSGFPLVLKVVLA